MVARPLEASRVHQHGARVAAEHARRLLGARPVANERPSTKARRSGRQAVDAHVRQILARRLASRVRARAQPLRRIERRTNHAAHERRLVTTINGTFDWVYEEELDLRDGFRWSPDGKHVAYWQLDARACATSCSIDNTDSLYSFVKPVQYPKAGTTNSAARIGVVSAAGGPTRGSRFRATRATTTSRAWSGSRARTTCSCSSSTAGRRRTLSPSRTPQRAA